MNVSVTSGAYQMVHIGGVGVGTVIGVNGRQVVYAGGTASGGTVLSGGGQMVSGTATGTTVSSGGWQIVSSGARANGGAVSAGGSQHIRTGGVASGTIVRLNGRQYVSAGGRTSGIVLSSGGYQMVLNGATGVGTVMSAGGRQVVYAGGTASGGTVLSGGGQMVSGTATGTTVSSGGWQIVTSGGRTLNTSVLGGGKLVVSSGATAQNANVAQNGTLQAVRGAVISGMTVSAGANLQLGGGVTVNGTNNASGANITISGTNNNVSNLTTTGATTINYDIRNVSASETAAMLRLTTSQTKAGQYSITVKAGQGVGTYELSNNLTLANGTAFTIRQDNTTLGTVQLNGSSLVLNGVSYRVTTSGTQINLTVSSASGKLASSGANVMSKAVLQTETGAANDSAVEMTRREGTTGMDVFYGGAGNEVISGVNGQDVVVYDGNGWGQDVIASTEGTMTVLFSGISADDVVMERNGSDMMLSRASDASQRVLVENWNDVTHRLVYGDTLSEYSRYLQTASPTVEQKTAAYNEVWKAAGMLAQG